MKRIAPIVLAFALVLSSCMVQISHELAGNNDIQAELCMPLLLPRGISGGETIEGPVDEKLAPTGGWLFRKQLELKSDTWIDLIAIQKAKNTEYLVLFDGNQELHFLDTKRLQETQTIREVSYSQFLMSQEGSLWTYNKYVSSDFQFGKIQDNQVKSFSVVSRYDPEIIYSISSGPSTAWIVFSDNEMNYFLGELHLDTEYPLLANLTKIDIPIKNGMTDAFEIYPTGIYGFTVDNYDRPYFSYLSKDTSYINTYRLEHDMSFKLINQVKTRSYGTDGLTLGFGLYIDENDVLWIGDAAWVNIGENPVEYYQQSATIYRSPIFVAKMPPGDGTYRWLHGTPTADTADGRIWYQSKRGTAWYQPSMGNWCMFSNSPSPVLKDSEGNLWLVYENALYMLPASETNGKK